MNVCGMRLRQLPRFLSSLVPATGCGIQLERVDSGPARMRRWQRDCSQHRGMPLQPRAQSPLPNHRTVPTRLCFRFSPSVTPPTSIINQSSHHAKPISYTTFLHTLTHTHTAPVRRSIHTISDTTPHATTDRRATGTSHIPLIRHRHPNRTHPHIRHHTHFF